MKTLYTLITLFFLFCSCQEERKPTEEREQTETTVDTTKVDNTLELKADSISDNFPKFNYTDQNGLKQGIWKAHYKDFLTDSNYYLNGKLHGKQFHFLADGTTEVTEYKNGMKNGFFLSFPNNDNVKDELKDIANFCAHFRNDSIVYNAFPSMLAIAKIPLKKSSVKSPFDSAYISIPYKTGEPFYEGKMIKSYPIGEHKIYFKNGEVKYMIKYTKDSIFIFDEDERLEKKNVNLFKQPYDTLIK